MNINESQILKYWEDWDLPNHIPVKLTRKLAISDIHLLKDVTNRSIWRINAPINGGTFPVILKLCDGPKNRQVESLLYRGAQNTFVSTLIPEIYMIRNGETGHGTLMFMECLKVIANKGELTPEDLYKIIPFLAKLHALTFNDRDLGKKFQKIVPTYSSDIRTTKLMKCKKDVKTAMRFPSLKSVIEENCPELLEVLELDLDFPEVLESGYSLTHSDLTLNNIGYDVDNDDNWIIKFIDYGAATFAPCLFDLVKLVESPIDHRPDWDAESVRKNMINLYVEEMKNQGVTFNKDPEYLYKLSFLMRVFENEFRRNLHLSLKRGGQARRVFPSILKKISVFSHELALLETKKG